ncbi:MAG TPA: hypothetical protein VGH23_02250 [Rhizomicrobium sp.]
MNLSQRGVGGAMLATASGRIDLSNANDFATALSVTVRESKAAQSARQAGAGRAG